jgi:hypothetical protein
MAASRAADSSSVFGIGKFLANVTPAALLLSTAWGDISRNVPLSKNTGQQPGWFGGEADNLALLD